MSRRPLDVVGRTFGRLTVLRSFGVDRHGKQLVLAQCACGHWKVIRAASLTRGLTRSCGRKGCRP